MKWKGNDHDSHKNRTIAWNIIWASIFMELNCCSFLVQNVGCGITFLAPTIMGPSFLVATLLVIIDPSVQHSIQGWADIPFLSVVIMTNVMWLQHNMNSEWGHPLLASHLSWTTGICSFMPNNLLGTLHPWLEQMIRVKDLTLPSITNWWENNKTGDGLWGRPAWVCCNSG